MPMAKKELLVVGAGITGSLTAAFLSKSFPEVAVTMWEKARGAGGRMTTHRLPEDGSLHVDMGAQYISRFDTQEDLEYKKRKEEIYSELLSSRTLVPFNGEIEGGQPQSSPVLCNYVAPTGLSSTAKHFLAQSKGKKQFQHSLTSVIVSGKVECNTSCGTRANFDAVVLTLPVPEILKLEGNLKTLITPDIKTKLEGVQYSSRYALGLFYNDSTSLPRYNWSAKYFDNQTIRFACWDSDKRAVSQVKGRTLLLHTSVPFGLKNLESDKIVVQSTILNSLKDVIPGLPEATHSHIIRWRYSQVFQPYPSCPGCVVLCENPLVVATGDGFIGSNFENCLRAAYATEEVLCTGLMT